MAVTVTPTQNVWTVAITPQDAPTQTVISTPVNSVNVAVAVLAGRDGRDGIDGTNGTGAGGENLKYIHSQTTESAEWIVNHNLGSKPVAEIISTGGAVVEADVLHVSDNQLRVYFSAAFTGSVRCI